MSVLSPQYKHCTDWGDLIKQGGDVKRSTTVLDFMDYWRLLWPAGRGIILFSLFKLMRVSRTQTTPVKLTDLTSECHACNPLVWYLCAVPVPSSLSYVLVFAKLPGFHWLYAFKFRSTSKVRQKYTWPCDSSAWAVHLTGSISIYYHFMLANHRSVGHLHCQEERVVNVFRECG